MNALEMRDRLDADFGGWYDLLSSYYAETIAQFTQAEEINTLRYSYVTDSPDMLLHDVDCIFQYGGLALPEIEEGDSDKGRFASAQLFCILAKNIVEI
ncbi:MAG: hypothetical protein MJY80_05985 [Bacteroidales bacterium]|nr:hypothetical protein [Bacteroidales bacterium]